MIWCAVNKERVLMDTLVTVVHFITAFLMIALILMQQGKGAEMGASFGGGSSQTVFGSTGGGSFFGKLTSILAVVFFVTSLGLALFAKNEADLNLGNELPVLDAIQTQVEQIADETEASEPVMPTDEFEFEEIPTSAGNDDVESPALEMPTE